MSKRRMTWTAVRDAAMVTSAVWVVLWILGMWP